MSRLTDVLLSVEPLAKDFCEEVEAGNLTPAEAAKILAADLRDISEGGVAERGQR